MTGLITGLTCGWVCPSCRKLNVQPAGSHEEKLKASSKSKPLTPKPSISEVGGEVQFLDRLYLILRKCLPSCVSNTSLANNNMSTSASLGLSSSWSVELELQCARVCTPTSYQIQPARTLRSPEGCVTLAAQTSHLLGESEERAGSLRRGIPSSPTSAPRINCA